MTVKLFGKQKETQPEEVVPSERTQTEHNELVLDIEGLMEAAEDKAPDLKSEPLMTPKQEQVQTLHTGLTAADHETDATHPEKTPEKTPEKPLTSVTYASVAEAVETAKKEPTGRFNRDAVDDETLLSELYALIGDPSRTAPSQAAAQKNAVKPAPRPAARITPEKLNIVAEEYEELPEEDSTGVPGWLKGAFILLISLLLSAMTFYAVASDLLGELF